MRLEQRLDAYNSWKTALVSAITELRQWAETRGRDCPEILARIDRALETLREDRVTLALAAEVSRGKTELINGLFFADHGRRLLPSAAGRTTMCPVEIFCDRRGETYLHALPIETRCEPGSLSDFRKQPQRWVRFPLDLASPRQAEEVLSEIAATRQVEAREAAALGLLDPDGGTAAAGGSGQAEIPKWRHILVSLPHPLLKKGLRILDTPGLNALGTEPELTLDILPSAQALVFVLAADTGVTASDMAIWRNHLSGREHGRRNGLTVVLNKVDTLWDDLSSSAQVEAVIEEQRLSVARRLGVTEGDVVAVSAQKGLLARVKGKGPLLRRSGMDALEGRLTRDLVEAREQVIRDAVGAEMDALIERTSGVLRARLEQTRKQHQDLRRLDGGSAGMMTDMGRRIRAERVRYRRTAAGFKAGRHVLEAQARELLEALDLRDLEADLERIRTTMEGSWTTVGLLKDMRELFDELQRRMQRVGESTEKARKLLRAIYRRFNAEEGFAEIQPAMFSVMKYRVDLELLCRDAEVFRRSPVASLTEKHFLIRRFFMVLVDRAADIFARTRIEAEVWLNTALDPLLAQIQGQKLSLERRMFDFTRVGRSREKLTARLTALEKEIADLSGDLGRLRRMRYAIAHSRPADGKVASAAAPVARMPIARSA
jgi:hypothetical protein